MEIVFTAIYGDIEKTVRLSIPHGMPGHGWDISIDGYHQGIILFNPGQPVRFYLNERSELTTADVEVLIERIMQQKSRY